MCLLLPGLTSWIQCQHSAVSTCSLSLSLVSLSHSSPFLHEFPVILKPQFACFSPLIVVSHHIPTQSPPVWCRPRHLMPDKLGVVWKEFANLQCLDIIGPSRVIGPPRYTWLQNPMASGNHVAVITIDYLTGIQYLMYLTSLVSWLVPRFSQR